MDAYSREGESEAERLDRNWVELLQELRVSQTGVQILTGFLLTLPLQQAFHSLSTYQRALYAATISLCIVATCLIITPVSMHRVLFRRRRKASLVAIGNRIAKAGLSALALGVVGVVMLVFSIVFSQGYGILAGAVTLALFLGAWLVLPVAIGHEEGMDADDS